jgi:hypothetical protein
MSLPKDPLHYWSAKFCVLKFCEIKERLNIFLKFAHLNLSMESIPLSPKQERMKIKKKIGSVIARERTKQ